MFTVDTNGNESGYGCVDAKGVLSDRIFGGLTGDSATIETRYNTSMALRLILVGLVVFVGAPKPAVGQQKSLVIGIDGLGFGEHGFSAVDTP